MADNALPAELIPRRKLNLAQRGLLYLALGLARLLRLCGYRGIALLARFFSFGFWHFCKKRRNFALASIMRHLELDEAAARRVAKQSFYSNFLSFLEMVFAPSFKLYDNPRLEYPKEFGDIAVMEDRPVLGVTCHLGAWELMSGILGQFRSNLPTAVVGRNQNSDVMTIFIHRMRSSGNGHSVGHRNIAPLMSKIMRENGTAAFVVDHNAARSEAIFLPFLGEAAAVNVGPAMLALRSKAIVMPVCLARLAPGRYQLQMLECLDTATLEGSIKERTRQIAEFYTKASEAFIRRFPEQWFWMHNRWKTRPREEKRDRSGGPKTRENITTG